MGTLDRYTHPSDGSWRMHPFTISIRSMQWQVATDRAWVVATRGKGGYPNAPAEDPIAKRLVHMLSLMVPSSAIEADVEQILNWSGRVGEDFATKEQRPGILQGVVLDLRRLAYLLEGLPEKTVRVWNTTDIGVASVGFDANGKWRAYLAGIGAEPSADMPVFVPKKSDDINDLIAELDQE